MAEIQSANFSSRNGQKVIWAVIHTTEGILDAKALGSFFQPASRQVSSHAGADRNRVVSYVDDQYAAWTLRNGNQKSINIEIGGFANWSREKWLGEEYGRLVQAAKWVREKCDKFGIPKKHIGIAGVQANSPGIITHDDYSKATKDGTHWDPGPGFPMDVFIALVNNGKEDDELQNDERNAVISDHGLLWYGGGESPLNKGLVYVVKDIADQQKKMAEQIAWMAATLANTPDQGSKSLQEYRQELVDRLRAIDKKLNG